MGISYLYRIICVAFDLAKPKFDATVLLMSEDTLAKLGLQAVLSPYVTLSLQHEVFNDAQYVDVFVSETISEERREPVRAALGWLGVMVAELSMLEAFSDSVTPNEARQCFRKQDNLHHQLQLNANKNTGSNQPDTTTEPPWLWILSTGHPRTLIDGWPFAPAANWPTGFYATGVLQRRGVVVLTELPKTRDTLLLRLFGGYKLRQEAIPELQALPHDDPMMPALVSMLYRWQVWAHGHPEDTMNRQQLVEFQELVKREEQRLHGLGRIEGERAGRLEGRQEAQIEGLRTTITDLCEAFSVDLTDLRRASLQTLPLESLEKLRAHLKQHRSWPEDSLS